MPTWEIQLQGSADDLTYLARTGMFGMRGIDADLVVRDVNGAVIQSPPPRVQALAKLVHSDVAVAKGDATVV